MFDQPTESLIQQSSQLVSEALLAVSGLFPREPVGPQERDRAKLLSGEWRTQIKNFFDRDKPTKFRMYRRPSDFEKISDDIVTGQVDIMWLTSKFVDPDITHAYVVSLNNAHQYIRQHIRILEEQTFTGPKKFLPGWVTMADTAAVYAVVDKPSRLIDEILSATVLEEQVSAIQTVYPTLFQMLISIFEERKYLEMVKVRSYSIPWWKERVIRIIYGIPFDKGIQEQPSPPPQMRSSRPQMGTEQIQVDFRTVADHKTTAQQIETNRNG